MWKRLTITMKNNVRLASCGLLAVALVACGGGSGGSPTQSNSEGIQNGYNSFGNTLTDSRDGQVYRTVTIGEQTWMAENLNYAMDGSYCYDDDPANCAKYGRLYTWSVSKTACPSGWHLPTKDDWWTLFDLVNEAYPDSAKWALLAKGYDHWPKAFDAYGFSALPAGEGGFYGELTRNLGYKWLNHTAFFQISTSSCSVSCDLVCLDDDCAAVFLPNNSPTSAHSVRCLKNDAFYQEPSQLSAKSSSSFENSSNSAEDTCVDSKSVSCPEQSELGTICDNRDGKIYKVVTIGTQTWMIENLNFSSCDIKGFCYDNDPNNCNQYGRLYSWTDVMGLDKSYQNKYSNLTGLQQGICPQGFHIPSNVEVDELITFVDANGGDAYLLAIMFGGKKSSSDFSDLDKKAYFWTTDEDHSDFGGPNNVIIWTYSEAFGFGGGSVFKDSGLSARCVKD